MLNRTLTLLFLSVGLYYAHISGLIAPLSFGQWQTVEHQENGTDLLAQESPNNIPHRGSGRCDKPC
ncbi:MAG: hypothetical protein AAGD25_04340 [Cyanobacteria bacterium P01_F01_bin.150]